VIDHEDFMSVHELNRLILNPVLSIVSPLPVYNPSKMAVNWLCETNRIHIYSLWYFIQIYYHTISHLQNGLPLIMRIHISYNSLWYLYSDILFFQCFWLYYILPAVAVIPDIESLHCLVIQRHIHVKPFNTLNSKRNILLVIHIYLTCLSVMLKYKLST
jgi:hypothetical protein